METARQLSESGEHVSLDALAAQIARLGADLSVRLERWLALVAEFDRREGARRSGFRSTAEWLAWRCGIGLRAARDHVRVARGLATRPVVREAFACGELSYSKVRALTRVPDGEDERELVQVARSSTAGELERLVRGLRCAPSADAETANRGHARRHLDWWWEPDGSLCFRGRFGADDGAAFIEMIETAADALCTTPDAVSATSEAVSATSDAVSASSDAVGVTPAAASAAGELAFTRPDGRLIPASPPPLELRARTGDQRARTGDKRARTGDQRAPPIAVAA